MPWHSRMFTGSITVFVAASLFRLVFEPVLHPQVSISLGGSDSSFNSGIFINDTQIRQFLLLLSKLSCIPSERKKQKGAIL